MHTSLRSVLFMFALQIVPYDGRDFTGSVDGPIEAQATPFEALSSFVEMPGITVHYILNLDQCFTFALAANLLGLVEKIKPAEDFVSKKGVSMKRQSVVLYDRSASGLPVTL